MRSRNNTGRNKGVVLLLILGLMAMFAMLVLAYMVVTANMAETARTYAEAEAKRDIAPREDANYAIKTLLAGSNNRRSPIAPFNILENLYGNSTYRDMNANEIDYTCDVDVYYEDIVTTNGKITSGWLALAPDNSIDIKKLFEETGSVVTFVDADVSDWTDLVNNTTALIVEKVVVDPEVAYTAGNANTRYKMSDGSVDGRAFTNNWYMKVALTDSLKAYFNEHVNLGDVNSKDEYKPSVKVTVRFNRPAFAGTGAGYFSPESLLDGQTPKKVGTSYTLRFGVPWLKWANASAPDLTRFSESTDVNDVRTQKNLWSAQTFWAHLMDGNYLPANYVLYTTVNGKDAVEPGLQVFVRDSMEPVRMNPSYTAPDSRSLFLAWYNGTPVDSSDITPSFHRPELFDWVQNQMYDPDSDNNPSTSIPQSIFGSANENPRVDTTAVIRKLTPRPLQLDHWHFTGSNPDRDLSNTNMRPAWYGNLTSPSLTDLQQNVEMDACALLLAQKMGTGAGPNGGDYKWDVDNDNDGIKDGIWVPSGLPVRMSADGTPYFTMYSFTVVDMDGRINVNTAGNWDQIPNTSMHNYAANTWSMCYESLMDITESNYMSQKPSIRNYATSNMESLDQQNGGLADFYICGWADDRNNWMTRSAQNGNVLTERGTGYGPAGINLRVALQESENNIVDAIPWLRNGSTAPPSVEQKYFDRGVIASNLLWRRYETHKQDHSFDLPLWVDKQSTLGSNGTWMNLAITRDKFTQPGDEYTNASSTPSDRSLAREQFSFMNPIMGLYPYNFAASVTNMDRVDDIVFPWRGKTRITDNNYDKMFSLYPTFNYTDTAFRSYDVLGHEIYTYPPRHSENPYLARVDQQSFDDSPYTIADLERILRPFDSDSAYLSQKLIGDLTNNAFLDSSVTGGYRDSIRDVLNGTLRQSLTTVSSDIPATSAVYVPSGEKTNINRADFSQGGGAYGITSLVRMCVTAEYMARIENSLTKLGVTLDSNVHAILADISNNINKEYIDGTVSYLVSLLPEETLLGKKIDLNKLSQRTYWLDVQYRGNNTDLELVNTATSTGDGGMSDENKEKVHNYGLAKRMEYARGLYILMMALTYEDRNANKCYDAPPAGITYKDYFEKGLDAQWLTNISNQDERAEYKQELVANRIAQWCVNVIDFSDPDATMTPFYYDPNPFDGWWGTLPIITDTAADAMASYIFNNVTSFTFGNMENDVTALADPETGNNITLFATPQPLFSTIPSSSTTFTVLPKDRMRTFFYDSLMAPDTTFVDSINPNGFTRAKWIAETLKRKTDLTITPPTRDYDFRLVWGMERPDLVLTETLNFHDLGIADTNIPKTVNDNLPVTSSEENTGTNYHVGGGTDNTFDQVRRPMGSSYLELYCTANPNIPQSPELYHFNNDTNQWELQLSKKTPVTAPDSEGNTMDYPIWRIAITDSRGPRGAGSGDAAQYRKEQNCVINQIMDYSSLFSFQPKQFRNLPVKKTTVLGNDLEKYNKKGFDSTRDGDLIKTWQDFDLPSASLLGLGRTLPDETTEEKEMEIDRIVWFANAPDTDVTGVPADAIGTAGKFADAARTFVNNTNANLYLAPNQYLVVGPEEVRSIGSWCKNATASTGASNKYDKNGNLLSNDAGKVYEPGQYGQYGVPSLNRIDLTKLVGNYKTMVAVSTLGRRGLNISEPLWTSKDEDPYAKRLGKTTLVDGTTGAFLMVDRPFEMPVGWAEGDSGTNDDVKNFPIVEDELFGVGTVPAYKSAFVQRVADPNRPYHPILNPYISIDWNLMDLTVFTGESYSTSYAGHDDCSKETSRSLVAPNNTTAECYTSTFCYSTPGGAGNSYPFADSNNLIKLNENKALNIPNTNLTQVKPEEAFSSRAWGNFGTDNLVINGTNIFQQEVTAPAGTQPRPNPWARAFSFKDVQISGALRYGLTLAIKPKDDELLNVVPGATIGAPVASTNFAFAMRPYHTLGAFNDAGKRGYITTSGGPAQFLDSDSASATKTMYAKWQENFVAGNGIVNWYSRLNIDFHNHGNYHGIYGGVYKGSPGSTNRLLNYNAIPMEHLVWNDAPFNNPDEIMLVPASAPGRFGVEFVRNSNANANGINLATQYFGSGRSLGTASPMAVGGANEESHFGFAYTDPTAPASPPNAVDKKLGPYLNFFNGSTIPGRSLNLGRLLDFVYVPSPVVGTRTFRGYEKIDDGYYGYFAGPVLDSTMREPGKININTVSQESIWDAIRHGLENTSTSYATLDGQRQLLSIQPQTPGRLNTNVKNISDFSDPANTNAPPLPAFYTLQRPSVLNVVSDDPANEDTPITSAQPELLFPTLGDTTTSPPPDPRQNMYAATQEMQQLSGLTTTRSNVFAVWITVGYFEAERVKPGENVPLFGPDGTKLTTKYSSNPSGGRDLPAWQDINYPFYHYYKAIYPDGYTYGRELGSVNGEIKRSRFFYLIDRSIPVDFRRGESRNWEDTILIQRQLD
ncbi:MAG: hypothetical protein Q4G68_10195 [Planctomycetia bacterium]|nr:hypothetical protein [Planctomycetia bacterium]